MAVVGEKTDMTAELPDEVLSHVFSFLSLSNKLRLESVNHKFQRCVLEELKANPRPLGLGPEEQSPNGYNVPLNRIFDACQSLAKRAKFSSVEIGFVEGTDMILSLLISQSQCLSKVTSFVTYVGCSQTVLKDFLDKCGKLTSIKLEFDVCPVNSQTDDWVFPLDLGHVLKNKRLTKLKLCPCRYPQKDLAQAFRAVEANSLRKLTLVFNEEMLVNMTQLVDALSPHGSTLEQMRLELSEVDVQLAHLFQSMHRLPALHKCDIDCVAIDPEDQLVAVGTALFMKSEIDIQVSADSYSLFPDVPGCQIVDMISQIQKVHPGVVVDFDENVSSLFLTLGKASIQRTLSGAGVGWFCDEDCECQSFYPCLFGFLCDKAARRSRRADRAASRPSNFEDAQHPDWQLDRCRVEKVVGDLQFPDWGALSADTSEDQQSVTIHFETKTIEPKQFSITVGCGRCLTNGCMKCMD